jgi:DNA-binding NarL/FixJ family response regulator
MRRARDPNRWSNARHDDARPGYPGGERAARGTRSLAAHIRLVLADEHPIVLDGLDGLFRAEPDVRVIARCATSGDTLAAVGTHHPHVLILDPHIPGPHGLAILYQLQRDHAQTSVVLFAASLSGDEAIEALRLGVRGMVLKEQAPAQLVHCVRKVHAGEQWIERTAIGNALKTLLRREAGAREAASVLTPRELEMVRMVAHGLGNDTIAQRLDISPGTVKDHLHHVYRKLKLAGRIDLVLYARERQLL